MTDSTSQSEPDSQSKSEQKIAPQKTATGVNHWLVIALLFCGAALLFRLIYPAASSLFNPQADSLPITPRGDLAEDEKTTIEIFQNASPSVVHINTSDVRLSQDRFELNELEIPKGSGSGFVWNKEGYIVTNFHVVQNAERAQVTFADKSSYPARFVGGEASKDIAVLKIESNGKQLIPIKLGESKSLLTGQKVFAIGSPFGLPQTLTTGVISGLDREIRASNNQWIHDVIQTDAAINPGNSGGPLLDSAGLLIGMNTAIFSPSGTNAGVGFAIPSETINQIVPQLIRTGKVERAGLGIIILPDRHSRRFYDYGVAIQSITPNSAADKAGLQGIKGDSKGGMILGDVIIAINNKKIGGRKNLLSTLGKFKVGDQIKVTVMRNKEEKTINVTLQALPSFSK